MTDIQNDVRDKMRRSIDQEFVRMEEDFDKTRQFRGEIIDSLMASARKVKITNAEGDTKEETPVALAVMTTALKALSDAEKANEKSISLKIRHKEQEASSAAATKDRIEFVLKATAPGRIQQTFPEAHLAEQLSEMFDESIKDFELKSSPRDLDAD